MVLEKLSFHVPPKPNIMLHITLSVVSNTIQIGASLNKNICALNATI
uniref:Uncharacterized protein n=1 Tax=Rhizophora mucronata TaxID=61149 RepID=A0A2P2K6Y7_RHIMU